jgi:hypothetical protein
VPPSLTPSLALVFLLVYVPIMLLAQLHAPLSKAGMRQTSHKNTFSIKARDRSRFCWYAAAHVLLCAAGLLLVGWMATASAFQSAAQDGAPLAQGLSGSYSLFESGGGLDRTRIAALWHVQDVMSVQMLLSLLAQAATLTHRGGRPAHVRAFSLFCFISSFLSLSITHTHAQDLRKRGYVKYDQPFLSQSGSAANSKCISAPDNCVRYDFGWTSRCRSG